jgi:hypothetical protein
LRAGALGRRITDHARMRRSTWMSRTRRSTRRRTRSVPAMRTWRSIEREPRPRCSPGRSCLDTRASGCSMAAARPRSFGFAGSNAAMRLARALDDRGRVSKLRGARFCCAFAIADARAHARAALAALASVQVCQGTERQSASRSLLGTVVTAACRWRLLPIGRDLRGICSRSQTTLLLPRSLSRVMGSPAWRRRFSSGSPKGGSGSQRLGARAAT